MSITLEGKQLSKCSDKELSDWLKGFGTNKPRDNTFVLWIAILRAFDEIGTPATVRQMFYALETKRVVPKTENGYKQVDYRLLQMRRLKIIPYDFIADSTRWMRKPKTYDSLSDFLQKSQETYRHSLWAEQNSYVEIWIEKDALAGVVYEVTSKWDVPLMVTRGFPSETFVYEAAQNIKSIGKDSYIYYFGDYDPSGKSISDGTSKKLAGFGADFEFERVAVTHEQIVAMNLPTRPTKKSDTRSRNWKGDSVELDAIPPNTLREMVEDCIVRHVDGNELERIRRIETAERETLETVASSWGKK